MKILYYILTFGTTPFITSQIREIAEINTVKVLCNSNLLEKSKLSIEQVELNEPNFIRKIRRKLELSDITFSYFNPFWARSLKLRVTDFDPDIIHIQFGYDAVMFLQNYFPTDKPIAITFRGYDASLKLILKGYRNQLNKILSRDNVYPIFVSKSLRNNLVQAGIEFNSINEVLYSNTDTDFFKRSSYGHERNRLRFTQVSNFREKKGHIYTIRAFELVADQINFQLTFVGRKDRDYENLLQSISNSPILERIEFIDALDKEGIKGVLEESHFFIHNSITSKFNDQEGIPNSVMEAMSMELPILTTLHAGIPELDNGEVDIFYSVERDIPKYAENIINAVECGGYSKRNRDRIVTSFSRKRFSNQLMNFYKTISKQL